MELLTKIEHHVGGRALSSRGAMRLDPAVQYTIEDFARSGVFLAQDQMVQDGLVGGGEGGGPGVVPREALESWIPGVLRAITRIRNSDEITGVTVMGRWEDESIKMRTEDYTGRPKLYSDDANTSLVNLKTGAEERGIVRFELGLEHGELENKRLTATGYDGLATKRIAVASGLNDIRDSIAFHGFRDSQHSIFGLLNDENLPGYLNYDDTNGGGVAWKSATYENLKTDFLRIVGQLKEQTGGRFKDHDNILFVLPMNHSEIMYRTSTGGREKEFHEWLKQTFPNHRIVWTPEFEGAHGGCDVMYAIAENISEYDDSDVGSATLTQIIPERYRILGSKQEIKSYYEIATNATAGVLVKRPWGVVPYVISVGE